MPFRPLRPSPLRPHRLPMLYFLPVALVWLGASLGAHPALATTPGSGARLVILMVWDGLRPDSVTATCTPNLHALASEGVLFADHHAIYPSQTMVNAAVLATGAAPSETGITGNVMYLAPLLAAVASTGSGPLARALTEPVSIENPALLAALGSHHSFDRPFMGVQSIAHDVLRQGGQVGIVGKAGPTFLFDVGAGDSNSKSSGEELFVSDDRVAPASLEQKLRVKTDPALLAAAIRQDPPFGNQDTFLAQVLIDHALPEAATAVRSNRSALLVFWQHNPDITQHLAGLEPRLGQRHLRSAMPTWVNCARRLQDSAWKT